MPKLSYLFNKKIIAVCEGKFLGTCCGFLIRKSGFKTAYILFRSESVPSFTAAVPFKKVKDFGFDCLVTASAADALPCEEIDSDAFFRASPFCPVYLDNGKHAGFLSEIETDENFYVTNITAGNTVYSPKDLSSMSAELAVICECKPFKRKKARFSTDENYKVSLLSAPRKHRSEQKRENTRNSDAPPSVPLAPDGLAPVLPDGEELSEADSDEIYKDEHTPMRLISDYRFLLGRLIVSDITDSNKKVIIPKGDVITAKTVNKARKYGRLVELTLNSRC